jgi:hypothetical protein
MLAMTGFGTTSAETYAAAQAVVEALSQGSWEDAFATLGMFVGSDLNQVADKAIALGADPDAIQSLLETLNNPEVIEVTGEAPPAPAPGPKPAAAPLPVSMSTLKWWGFAALFALAAGGAWYAGKKLIH